MFSKEQVRFANADGTHTINYINVIILNIAEAKPDAVLWAFGTLLLNI